MIRIAALILMLVSQTMMAAPCETKRDIYFENKDTKVWKSTLCPHEKLAFHVHQYPRVLIPQENGMIRVIYDSGKMVDLELHKQQPVYLDIAQGKEMHQDINPGDTPLHLILIEIRKS